MAKEEPDAKAVEARLTGPEGTEHLAEVARLYELCESKDLKVVAEALQALGRVVAHHRKSEDENVARWARQHNEAYHAVLARLAASPQARAQACAVRLALTAVRDEALESSGLASVSRRLPRLVEELLLAARWPEHAARCLSQEYVAKFVDVRHSVVSHLRACAAQVAKSESLDLPPPSADPQEPAPKRRKGISPFADEVQRRNISPEELFSRILQVLREAPEPKQSQTSEAAAENEIGEEAELWAPGPKAAAAIAKGYRKVFQDAWVQLLSLPVPMSQCTPLLQLLPNQVIPHLSQPLILADFYLRAFHSGSLESSVQALSGLLLLLTRYGLGDPETLSSSCSEFYTQLYSLLKAETFALKRRARFQRLAAAALTSGLLPARFAAAFAKRCLRVAVACSEPGTVMWLLSVAYGLIQRHHSHCRYLLHRTDTEVEAVAEDPFDMASTLSTGVEQVGRSSLWEIQLLRRHHNPQVAVIARLFLAPFFKHTSRKLDPELFLDQSAAKAYRQALKAAERQASRWSAKGEKCPLAIKVEDDNAASRVAGWAAAMSTAQRRLGAGL